MAHPAGESGTFSNLYPFDAQPERDNPVPADGGAPLQTVPELEDGPEDAGFRVTAVSSVARVIPLRSRHPRSVEDILPPPDDTLYKRSDTGPESHSVRPEMSIGTVVLSAARSNHTRDAIRTGQWFGRKLQ